MRQFTRFAALATALLCTQLMADEPSSADSLGPGPITAVESAEAKQHIEQLDQKLQQLFSKIKTLQEEREQLEAMIEAKEDQLEALQEEVVVVLKQRDFYEQEMGSPEDEPSAPYQP